MDKTFNDLPISAAALEQRVQALEQNSFPHTLTRHSLRMPEDVTFEIAAGVKTVQEQPEEYYFDADGPQEPFFLSEGSPMVSGPINTSLYGFTPDDLPYVDFGKTHVQFYPGEYLDNFTGRTVSTTAGDGCVEFDVAWEVPASDAPWDEESPDGRVGFRVSGTLYGNGDITGTWEAHWIDIDITISVHGFAIWTDARSKSFPSKEITLTFAEPFSGLDDVRMAFEVNLLALGINELPLMGELFASKTAKMSSVAVFEENFADTFWPNQEFVASLWDTVDGKDRLRVQLVADGLYSGNAMWLLEILPAIVPINIIKNEVQNG